jgi:arylsulfatase A
MRRVIVPIAICALSLSPLVAGQAPNTAAAKPNVLLIITDDVGYGDIGSYGAPDIKTPNIDGLARAGVRFTDFYANGSSCSPTRAGLITGRYQQRYAIEVPLPTGAAVEQGLTATGRSLPQLLKNHGYATGLIGKWHLGYQPQMSPNAHGFEYFFGFKSGYIDYYQHNGGDGKPDLFENEKPIEVDGYMTDLVTQRSVAFIEQHATGPFFLDVAYNAAHWPYQRPDMPSKAPGNARHVQPQDDGTSTRADYVAVLERADRGVGEILRTLDRLKLTRNTIVIFTNDNGGEWLSRNAPLFHRKLTLWEGGIRVPAIVRWPGRIPENKVTDQVGITMDLTASILAATGAPVPKETKLEGIDLFPILEGKAPHVERTLFWRNTGTSPQRAVRRGDWKLLVDGGKVLVFNVKSDLGERNDLANQKQDLARQMYALLAPWEADVEKESGVPSRAGGAGRAGGARGARGAGGAAGDGTGGAGAGRGRVTAPEPPPD